jgi:hypothetical protein
METVEERLSRLEEQVSQLLEQKKPRAGNPWWERHFGAFKDDPMFDTAVRLGEEYRRSQPNPADSPDAVQF